MLRVEFQHPNKSRTHHRHTAAISANLPARKGAHDREEKRDGGNGGECCEDGNGPRTAQTGLARTTAIGRGSFHRKPGRAQWHGFGIVGGLGRGGAPEARIPRARIRGTVIAAKIKTGAVPGYLRPGFVIRLDGVAMVVWRSSRGIFSVVRDRGARRASVHWRRRSRDTSSTPKGSWHRATQDPIGESRRGGGRREVVEGGKCSTCRNAEGQVPRRKTWFLVGVWPETWQREKKGP